MIEKLAAKYIENQSKCLKYAEDSEMHEMYITRMTEIISVANMIGELKNLFEVIDKMRESGRNP